MVLRADEVRNAARRARQRASKSDEALLREARDTAKTKFDIFLSHSHQDRELVLGAKQLIEESGRTVYVDWIEDARLDRSKVSREHADKLRVRMRQCDTLFYAHTPSASVSKWCPWELGYFDAFSHPDCQVYVLPILEGGERYEGQEYLSLYETVDLSTYHHRPRRVREYRAAEQKRLADALGMSLRNPLTRRIF
ncbi:MAG: toll/interleukin-1 receptor domain-containing protein [Alphaproteobacteria bacterium]|nr:toll/interleukin-1 receptor domain-containing protein [Alphaproteobacteria bacterium]MBU0793135.1 toll/interleukin-1 receptor domain-containing protein [Alphaproteobacteria bacterium]MBU0875602.1 toll/interleukin-1 receptor domain-containing protein [Alphaproteobacteria bacterium]MBU1771307.1 toll/interleukin-1 receptor domain-containing protein [Alphaproteobacteria bacterium]